VPFVLVADYTGMKMGEFNELRTRLGANKAEFRVVKNTLLRKALLGSDIPDLDEHLRGQSAVVLGDEDLPAIAKVLKAFTAEFKKPNLKVGIIDKAVVGISDFYQIADMPPKSHYQAKLLGLLNTPATSLVSLLEAPSIQILRLLNAPASQIVQVLRAQSAKGE
jgi:large subunit ribosomal protein L10